MLTQTERAHIVNYSPERRKSKHHLRSETTPLHCRISSGSVSGSKPTREARTGEMSNPPRRV